MNDNRPRPVEELVKEEFGISVPSQNSEPKKPQGIEKQPLLGTNLTYSEVEERVISILPGTQKALKVVLATAISSQFKFPAMIWMLLVDVPSSGKTDFARFIKDSPFTYYLDTLTQNAFISGERNTEENKVHDLLPQLNNKCFVVKDWTSVFSLDEKMTKKILGDFVNIYDKEFAKFSPKRGNISYESYFSHLGCVTPATLNKHATYMNMVGARFLCYTMPSITPQDEEKSRNLIFSETADRQVMEKETRKYVSSYLHQLSQKQFVIKSLSKETEKYIWVAARLVAHCRGIIILQSATFKNEDGDDIKYYDLIDVQIERPWRALIQLITLVKCLAFIAGKDEVGTDELEIIKDVVLSSMPADRSKALKFIKEHNGQVTAKELAELSDLSIKTSRRLLEELCGLKVLEKIKGIGAIATDYKVNEEFRDFISLTPPELLSSHSNGTEKTHGIQKRQYFLIPILNSETKEEK